MIIIIINQCNVSVTATLFCNWCTWNSSKNFERKKRGYRNQRKNREHPDYNTNKID